MELNHVRRGAGEPLLLVHGLGGEWFSWQPLLERFAAERDVVAVDMPGFGASSPLPDGAEPSPQALADAIAAFVRGAIGAEPVDVAGHSLGGWVALELARLGVARRVTAVAPAGFWRGWERAWARASLRAHAWASRHPQPALQAALDRPRVRAVFTAGQFSRMDRVSGEAVRRMSRMLDAGGAYDETTDAMLAREFDPGDEIGAPTTVLWGTRDGLLLPQQARRAGNLLPEAEIVMLRRAGHFAHWDEPDAVARAVLGA